MSDSPREHMNPQALLEQIVQPVLAGSRHVSVRRSRLYYCVCDLVTHSESGKSLGVALRREQLVALIERLHEALDVADGNASRSRNRPNSRRRQRPRGHRAETRRPPPAPASGRRTAPP